MSKYRGRTLASRYAPRIGLDLTQAAQRLGTLGSIKLRNASTIGDQNTGRTQYGGLELNLISALKGTVAEFGFPHNIEALTEQAAGYAKVFDLSANEYQPLSTSGTGAGYTNNYQLFPDTEAIGDYAIFGGAAPFGAIWTNVSATVATYGADAITWQYWNGTTWASLTILWDQTDSDDQDGDRPFQEDGYTIFSAPTDWAASTIDSQSAYWIRCYVAAAQITQIPLLDSVEHSLVACAGATEVPMAGTIGRGRLSWTTVSGSNADTKVILMNLTSGACSAIKTLTKQLQEHEVANFAVSVARDDQLAFFYTQEDGTTELANGIAELRLVASSG